MPGFNNTGPVGGGPMTGRGFGYCMTKIEDTGWLARCGRGMGIGRRRGLQRGARAGLGIGRRGGRL